MLTLTTWNVLHRIHAENWGEDVPHHHPDERARQALIAKRLAARFAEGVLAMALQEVSGDQLAILRAALPPSTHIFTMCYPRVPRLKLPGNVDRAALLDDPSEHLVLVVAGSTRAHQVHAVSFTEDPGKGLLAVEIEGGPVVINTHVSWGERRREQLSLLATTAHAMPGTVVLLGDFNADRTTVGEALGSDFQFVLPSETALPTRPRTSNSAKSEAIDHVIVLRGECFTAEVIDAEGLSDHNLVAARVALPSGRM